MKTYWLAGLSILAFSAVSQAHEEHAAAHTQASSAAVPAVQQPASAEVPATQEQITVKGEILDLACYLDHGGEGAGHASCAQTCVESGLPVGIKDEQGKVYLLIGEHKPLNKTLAPYAGKTITVRGKAVSRAGINMIANAEVVE
ncbi:MAG: hypothetical protein IT369_13475 [Candidatus Latescibacteria bacterium]|nr:hypothetical protein [Candidatus Latescibacterota bacterium]